MNTITVVIPDVAYHETGYSLSARAVRGSQLVKEAYDAFLFSPSLTWGLGYAYSIAATVEQWQIIREALLDRCEELTYRDKLNGNPYGDERRSCEEALIHVDAALESDDELNT